MNPLPKSGRTYLLHAEYRLSVVSFLAVVGGTHDAKPEQKCEPTTMETMPLKYAQVQKSPDKKPFPLKSAVCNLTVAAHSLREVPPTASPSSYSALLFPYLITIFVSKNTFIQPSCMIA